MKNTVICSNCSHENQFVKYSCSNCKAFLRDRVPNIDIWKTFWQFLETPKKAFKSIILSEQKNYTLVILFFLAFKLTLLGITTGGLLKGNFWVLDYFFTNYAISLGYLTGFIILFSLIIMIINRSLGVYTRFRDTFALYTYSLWPMIFAAVGLSLLQYALFGEFYFTFNPSPFLIKPLATWVLIGFEAIFIFGSLYYAIVATYTQTKSKIYSIFIGIIFISGFLAINLFLPLIPQL